MNLNKEILRLALPSILANITVPLVGMVDMAVVGHLGGGGSLSGAALIGGISVGAMLFDMLYWNFAFLRAGTGGLTAQAYGRNAGPNGPEIPEILGKALRIALLSGVGLIALQWVVVQLAFLVVQCTPEVRLLATQYFYIRVWAAPATLSLFALKGWFIGLQDTLRPMLVDLFVNIVNIGLSIGLAFGVTIGGITLLPALGFSGVAIGTVIAQLSGFILALALAAKYLKLSHLLKVIVRKPNDYYQQNADIQQLNDQPSATSTAPPGVEQAQAAAAPASSGSFLRLNRDLFLRSVGMIAVYIGFTVLAAGLGDLMLALSAILMKLLMLFSYFSDGFAYAGEALTGRYIGEQSADGVHSTVRGTFLWGIVVAALFMLLYGFGGVPLLRLMTSDTSVVEAGRAFLPWLLLMPIIGCPAFIWDGIFIGATASKDLRNSTLLCAVVFFAVWFIGISFVPSASGALHLLMAAYFAHLAIRAVYLTIRYRPAVWNQISA